MSDSNEMKHQILSARYFRNGESTYEDLCHRVANFIGNTDQEREMFYDMMITDEFLPNSPTLMNAGRPDPFMSACVVLPINDTLESIFTTIKHTALIHQCGGGTGFSFNNLRPDGALVHSSEGKASGPVSFMTVFDRATNVVSQGGCFTGDTLIMTTEGPTKISNLVEGDMVYSYDKVCGFVLRPCSNAFKTMENTSVLEVITSNDLVFKATPTHPIMNINGSYKKLEDIRPGYVAKAMPLSLSDDTGDSIVSITPLEQKYDVWNVEVEETHNYVVCNADGSSGIVVSNSRRGANLGCIKVDHPDIMKFIDCKAVEGNISNFNISIMITDKFMDLVKSGNYSEVFTRTVDDEPITVGEIWDAIVKHAWGNGEPGVLFYDTFNKYNSTPVTGSIESTNPCVVGDTTVLTKDGYRRIDTLVGKECEIWNGHEWSKVTPQQTGENEDVFEVLFSNGRSIVCTNYHTWYIGDGKRVHTSDLKPGDTIVPYNLPVMRGEMQLPAAYIYGQFCGSKAMNKEESFMEYLKTNKVSGNSGWGTAIDWDCNDMKYCSNFMPDESYAIVDRIAFALGFVDAHMKFKDTKEDIKNADYTTIIHTINADRLCRFCELIGMDVVKYSDTIVCCKGEYDASIVERGDMMAVPEVSVTAIIPRGVADKVYCMTEPLRHTFVANGILTGNCGEQGLLAYESCTLGSINLTKFVTGDNENPVDFDKLGVCVAKAVLFLDNVVSKNAFPIPDLETAAKKTRKIGLGVMGWADMLIELGIPYNSQDALDLGDKVMRFINSAAAEQSMKLGQTFGSFEDFHANEEFWNESDSEIRPYPYDVKRSAARNASITTVAPTGTISILANCSSGIEPNFSYVYKRKNVIGKEFMVIHPVFERDLKILCGDDKWAYDDIIQYMYEHGSIQNCEHPILTDKFKRIYVTALDVSSDYHILMQSIFQKHVTSSISKTINLPESATEGDVASSIIMAHDCGCKGLTLYRTNSRKNVVLNLADKKEKPAEQTTTAAAVTPAKKVVDVVSKGFAERPKTLAGTTYLVHSGCCDLYVTVNSYDGKVFETFVRSTGNGGCDANTNAMGRFISAWLRKGLDPNELIHSLNKVVCPACIRNKNSDGKSCAGVICKCIALESNKLKGIVVPANPQFIETERKIEEVASKLWTCPDCGEENPETGGCHTCKNCGYSKCG